MRGRAVPQSGRRDGSWRIRRDKWRPGQESRGGIGGRSGRTPACGCNKVTPGCRRCSCAPKASLLSLQAVGRRPPVVDSLGEQALWRSARGAGDRSFAAKWSFPADSRRSSPLLQARRWPSLPRPQVARLAFKARTQQACLRRRSKPPAIHASCVHAPSREGGKPGRQKHSQPKVKRQRAWAQLPQAWTRSAGPGRTGASSGGWRSPAMQVR